MPIIKTACDPESAVRAPCSNLSSKVLHAGIAPGKTNDVQRHAITCNNLTLTLRQFRGFHISSCFCNRTNVAYGDAHSAHGLSLCYQQQNICPINPLRRRLPPGIAMSCGWDQEFQTEFFFRLSWRSWPTWPSCSGGFPSTHLRPPSCNNPKTVVQVVYRSR